MVRDSTHRPRNTDELLSMSVRERSPLDNSGAEYKKDGSQSTSFKGKIEALISFFSKSTDCGEEEDSDDGDTIVQLKNQSLDDEIQSTIDELQRNSLTLREAKSGNGEEYKDRRYTSTPSVEVAVDSIIPIVTSSTILSSSPSHTHYQATTILDTLLNSTTSNEKQSLLIHATIHNLSSKLSSCLSTIEAPSTSNTINDFGVPVFNKDRPLFSESVRHMQRWRNLQGKSQGGDDVPFPYSEGGSSSDHSSLIVPRDKEKERARSRSNSADTSPAFPSLTNAKLPRPRSWVSNLLSVGSNSNLARLATTPIVRPRHHSFDDQSRQSSDLVPVSSLVLQDEFTIGARTASLQSLGNLQAASYSTPDLSPLPSSPGPFSRRKAAPQLLVRNLDSAPRGAFTPSIPFPQQSSTSSSSKEMTNPWNTFERDLSSRKDLIDPEEEEAMIHRGLAEKRRQGTLAGEERAVLDMLDEMNNAVDTFQGPLVSRMQSLATSSVSRSEHRQKRDNSRLQNASTSPTRLSVRAFASALDQHDASSRSNSPVRGGSNSPVRGGGTSPIRLVNPSSAQISSASSSLGRQQGSVRKVVEEREKLDLGLKAPRIHQKPDALPATWSSSASEKAPLESSSCSSMISPSMLGQLRQDSSSTVSSYASQTNAFLNRRATHAADKQRTNSPSLSYVSSAQGSSTTFWSKKGYTTESPITSPDLPTGSGDKMAFRFDSTRVRDANDRPFIRRIMTDETGLTSLGSTSMSPSSSKQSTMTDAQISSPVHAIDSATTREPAADTRPALFQTVLKAASHGSSISASILTTPKPAFADLDVSYVEGGVSPGKLGSPKKGAKDLIQFFEQTSAPNSPKQNNTRNRSNTPAALRQFKEALGTSSYENRPASTSLSVDANAMQGMIDEQAFNGQKRRSRGWMRAAEGVQSNFGESASFENEENLSSCALRLDSPRRSSRHTSGSFMRVGSNSFKSGMNKLVTALTPSGNRTANEGSNAGERRQSGAPTTAYHARDTAEIEGQHDQSERQSVISSRSLGTTRSFRQTTEEDNDLELNPSSTIDMLGQPGATSFRTGFVYYFNVHTSPALWQWAQAVLLPSAVALSWIPAGGGRMSVVLDLTECREVHSVPGPDHPSSSEDVGARVAREQGLNRICPWQLIFDDGVERMAVESARDRVQWVNAIWDAIGATRQVNATLDSTERRSEVEQREVVGSTLIAPPVTFNVELSEAPRVNSVLFRSQSRHVEVPPPVPPKADRDYLAVSTSNVQQRGSHLYVGDNIEGSKSQKTFTSAASEQDNFPVNVHATPETIYLPRTPRSRAMFSWAGTDDSEIRPGDSASQRPARSQTTSSRYTAIVGRGSDGKTSETLTATKRTAAQTIRDGVMGSAGGASETNTTVLAGILQTVDEETSSMGKATSTAKHGKNVGRSIVSSKATTTRNLPSTTRSSLSLETTGSLASQELARMLHRIEEQQRQREKRDAYLQSQLQTFQISLNDLSLASSRRKRGRRSTSLGSNQAHDPTSAKSKSNQNSAMTSVAADAAALLVMQEKLDKVLALVGNVNRSDLDADAPQLTSSPSLTRIENTLHSLMSRISPSSMPFVLAAHNRSDSPHGDSDLDGRDRAILADRLVKGTLPSSRRMSAPPDLEDEESTDLFSTPLQNNYADMPSSPSLAGDLHRNTSRSWYSSETPPLAPANSLREESIRSNVPIVAGGIDPISRGGTLNGETFYGTSHFNASFASSLDMEAEIRRRRMRQTAGVRADYPENSRGGWYTPLHSAQGSLARRVYGDAHGRNLSRGRGTAYSTIAANKAAGSVPWARSALGLNVNDQSLAPHSNPHVSQGIQTPALADKSASELGAVLIAIKENERTRQSQEAQHGDIARYLNELNSWLEKDVEDRSKEWRTLALGVTQLHEELNAMKTGAVVREIDDVTGLPKENGNEPRLEHGPAASLAYSAGVDGTRTAAPYYPYAPVQPGFADPMRYPNGAYGLGVNAPAPINGPIVSHGVKKSGTRTWRAETSAGSMRNNDAFSGPASIRDKKKEKADKKAEGRARRRDAVKGSGFAKIAAAAAGAALIAAATHEYDKHKENQRNAGKPEEASSHVDEKTGTFVQHKEIPEDHLGKIKEAAMEGDESKVREAVKHAAEAGAGAAAVHKLIGMLKDGSEGKELDEDEASGDEKNLHKNTHVSTDSEGTRSAKSSGNTLISSDGSNSLKEAAKAVGAGVGGGALALAVEEILKHLLEKKDEEKNRAKEEAQAEAAREAKRKAEEEAREKVLQVQRAKDKNDLVETILAKLKEEKAKQEADLTAKQKEMDPKSAIENLVAAINQQRAADGAHHATSDMALKQVAADLVRTHAEQNGKLVEAVNSAAKEMLRHNVDAHAEDLKKVLSKEVSLMFDDVGKIREAKRALEHEISDLFSIKARHLGSVTKPKEDKADKPPPPQPMAAWGQPILASPQKPKPLPIPMGPPAATMPKRDLVGPFSMSFGPRR